MDKPAAIPLPPQWWINLYTVKVKIYARSVEAYADRMKRWAVETTAARTEDPKSPH